MRLVGGASRNYKRALDGDRLVGSEWPVWLTREFLPQLGGHLLDEKDLEMDAKSASECSSAGWLMGTLASCLCLVTLYG
ncbi:hypothetical protein CPSG_10164 [Coccidioides posadasii str. Silveira]|uniref:Uncharacterized protein n=2 Tax=Coccidioides posadasii TaxID=199306 RepID=E9DK15_COCPS|nr:hypothetical protein CPSG_10164 [Coccidioides posadasii str. Silveira]KMM69416.1 hypothetical protein CPAG_05733 [Coccidioides posadasii RMSCC 3488]